MEILERELKDVLLLKEKEFLSRYVRDEPLILVYRYKFLDLAEVHMCAPGDTIWRLHDLDYNRIFGDPLYGDPQNMAREDVIEAALLMELGAPSGVGDFLDDPEIFDKPLDEMSLEAIQTAILKEYGKRALGKSGTVLPGTSQLAESFEYCGNEQGVHPILAGGAVKWAQVDAAVAYLTAWWDTFGEKALLKIRLGNVGREIAKARAESEKNPVCILLNDAWKVSWKNEDMAAFLREARSKILPLLAAGALELNEWLEYAGVYYGLVSRDLFCPRKLSKARQEREERRARKLNLRPNAVPDAAPHDVSLRDDFFSIQCAMVRSLKRPSMFRNACDAYVSYEKSLQKHPISAPMTFDWEAELGGYIEEMKECYPVFR